MSKERLEEIKNNITSNEVDSVKLHVADFVWLIPQVELGLIQQEQFHDMQKSIMKLQERVHELESFKNSVEYTVDTETIELIVENQDSDVALSSVETYDEEIYFLKKRVEDNDQAIVDLNKHVEELEDENVDLEQQNKRYREYFNKIIETDERLVDKQYFKDIAEQAIKEE